MSGDAHLTAAIAEDEETAKAAKGDHWYPNADPFRGWQVLDGPDWRTATLVAWSPGPMGSWPRERDEPTAAHIARHDPAREIREAEAKRKILALADEADEIEAALHDETAHRPKPGEVSIGDRIRAALASVWGDQSE